MVTAGAGPTDRQTYPFASAAWVRCAHEHLRAVVPPLGDRLVGVRFSACEVFTDPPAELATEPSGEVAWHLVIDGARAWAGRGVLDDADHAARADYESVLPIARRVYGDTPPASVAPARPAGTGADGPVPLRPTIPVELTDLLVGFHDHMARHTS